MMQNVADKNIPPSQVKADTLEEAIHQYTGKKISIPQATLDRLFDAMQCVRERKYRSGGAPERVREHIVAARDNLARDRAQAATSAERVTAAGHRLDSAFTALRTAHGV